MAGYMALYGHLAMKLPVNKTGNNYDVRGGSRNRKREGFTTAISLKPHPINGQAHIAG